MILGQLRENQVFSMKTSFKISVLASGSRGNAALIQVGSTAILIDAGISCRRIVQGLKERNLSPRDLGGVFLTHEHKDHIAGLEVFARTYGEVPIFASEKTWTRLPFRRTMNRDQMRVLPRSCVVGGLRIQPFSIPHDAIDPVGYEIFYNERKCTYLTDCGFVTKTCEQAVDGAEALILEANHDEDMVRGGPYPAPLKARILGQEGHLSNRAAADLLEKVDVPPEVVFLAHLSEMNNSPRLAYDTVKSVLEYNPRTRDVTLYVASQKEAVSNFSLK